MRTVTLTATAKFGYGGKEYIARITGRDPKFTFAREFVGSKGGKRREYAEYMTDEPGLYVTCDIDRKGGKDETYHLIETVPGTDGDLTTATIGKEDAMRVAKLLDAGRAFEEAVAEVFPPPTVEEVIDHHKKKLAESEAKNDPEGMIKMSVNVGPLKAGETVRRADLIAARKAEIARLEAEIAAATTPPPAEKPADDVAAVAFPDLFKNE